MKNIIFVVSFFKQKKIPTVVQTKYYTFTEIEMTLIIVTLQFILSSQCLSNSN